MARKIRTGAQAPLEMPMPEGATPFEMAPPSALAHDDFNEIKKQLLDANGNVKPVRPVSLDPCGKCGTVHPADKFPICECVKCRKIGQIVWCGQCMQCAWQNFASRFGEEIADVVFPKYGQWRKSEAERLQKEGMPWDK